MAIKGNGNPCNGAYIGFQLGKTFTQGTQVTKPFVGIGTSLCDPLATVFYDATADGVTGVMFDYLVTGASYVRLEVISMNDLSVQGIFWYRLFPQKAAWQTAVVPFDSLVLPDWDNVKAMDPTVTMLKKNALKKIQFAVQDTPGLKGTIAIDNVYFIGAGKITPIGGMSVPNVPVLTSPANYSTITGTTAALLYWSASTNATSYEVQVSTYSNFSMIFLDSTLTGTQLMAYPLAYGTSYFWRVRAINSAGVGNWSAAWIFTTSFSAQTLLSPADNASGFSANQKAGLIKIGTWLPSMCATGTLTILSISGKKLAERTISGPGWHTVTIADIPAGVHFLHVDAGNNILERKVLSF